MPLPLHSRAGHAAIPEACAGWGQPLFESKWTFESGTGWPSCNDPIEGVSRPPLIEPSAWCITGSRPSRTEYAGSSPRRTGGARRTPRSYRVPHASFADSSAEGWFTAIVPRDESLIDSD